MHRRRASNCRIVVPGADDDARERDADDAGDVGGGGGGARGEGGENMCVRGRR